MEGFLPRKLRILRAERGWSLEQAADRTGISRESLGLLERGKRHPRTPTLHKLAHGYGIPVAELMQEEEPVLSGKAEAQREAGPNEGDSEQQHLSYVRAWSDFMDELSGDIEEWKYNELGEVIDPADLPEHDFVPFLEKAVPLVRVYRRVYRIVVEVLAPSLRDEAPTAAAGREIERFERAIQRLSRVILSIATMGVEERVEQLASGGEASGEESAVVHLFAEASAQARGHAGAA
jgi:transcriptional regulator with XRE-family HTH domain